jgi:hypothetical protein
MKHFDSFPLIEDSNDDFLYFIENVYKTEREPGDIPIVVDAFYKKYAGSNLSIEFEIPFTSELKDKSFRNFTALVNRLECDSNSNHTLAKKNTTDHSTPLLLENHPTRAEEVVLKTDPKSRSKSRSNSRSKSNSKTRKNN